MQAVQPSTQPPNSPHPRCTSQTCETAKPCLSTSAAAKGYLLSWSARQIQGGCWGSHPRWPAVSRLGDAIDQAARQAKQADSRQRATHPITHRSREGGTAFSRLGSAPPDRRAAAATPRSITSKGSCPAHTYSAPVGPLGSHVWERAAPAGRCKHHSRTGHSSMQCLAGLQGGGTAQLLVQEPVLDNSPRH